MKTDRSQWLLALIMIGVTVAVIAGRLAFRGGSSKTLSFQTIAEVQAVHGVLNAQGKPIYLPTRLTAGTVVETDANGRGRARLDNGTTIVIDKGTRFELTHEGLRLFGGRIFLVGSPSSRTHVTMGEASVFVPHATVAIEQDGAKASAFCVSGEMTARDGSGAEHRVEAGETARVQGNAIEVAPEAAFDDWTAGMASPWSASGPARRAVGQLWGRLGPMADGDPGSPLTIRSMEVDARVQGETALTRMRTTYFNAGGDVVQGDFRTAIPPDATVSSFQIQRGDYAERAHLLVADRDNTTFSPSTAQLEWAGDGWLRGWIPAIAPGATLTIEISYFEWLSPAQGRIQYRYPMVADADPPRIGEFIARVDLGALSPQSVSAGAGALVQGSTVVLRKSDFLPTADIVVEATLPADPATGGARAFIGQADEEGREGDYLVVRTELPSAQPADGVVLALVLDVSGGTNAASFDAEKALAEALVRGLGPKDQIIVLAADDAMYPVGPASIGLLDDARRGEILEALGKLTPGGATDLGMALERAADALPKDAPAAMLIYVGDGRPTVGDLDMELIKTSLRRRPGGAPRLTAVAVGPLADRFALASLVRSTGPLLQIDDRDDAARVAVDLMAEALRPAVADVELVFPPGVDRIYPRGSRAMATGSTIEAVGRITGAVPRSVALRWRDARGSHVERRSITVQQSMDGREVRRRWASARVQELAFKAAGREAATSVAFREELLTPWTAWVVGQTQSYQSTPLAVRLLDLRSSRSAPFAAMFSTSTGAFGALTDPLNEAEADPAPEDGAYEASLRRAAQRMIEAAGKQLRACRDSRAALNPGLTGSLHINVRVSPDGRAVDVSVRSSDASSHDEALNRCVEVVVRSLSYPATLLTNDVSVEYVFQLPPARPLGGRTCSPTSMLPVEMRRGIWLERLQRQDSSAVFLEAKAGCELRTWNDKRTLLELMLETTTGGVRRIEIARELANAGEDDAAQLLRREALRRATDHQELWAVRNALIGDEQMPLGRFRKAYRAATTDDARLGVVRSFLKLAPHHSGLRRQMLTLLSATGKRDALLHEVALARQDPFADAALLATGAQLLRAADYEVEARRAYGELVERAPGDPSVRAYLGDLLRNEGWFDTATAAYAALEDMAPEEPGSLLRLSQAHAGAGRLDIATRLLTRLAQTGGRTADRDMGELGARLAAVLLTEAISRADVSVEGREQLKRRVMNVPWSGPGAVVLVRFPRLLRSVEVWAERGPTGARSEHEPDVASPTAGLASFRIDPADLGSLRIILRRPESLPPAASIPVRVDVLRVDGDLTAGSLTSLPLEMAADGKRVILRYDGKSLAPAPAR